jgi:hypothetical protein
METAVIAFTIYIVATIGVGTIIGPVSAMANAAARGMCNPRLAVILGSALVAMSIVAALSFYVGLVSVIYAVVTAYSVPA